MRLTKTILAIIFSCGFLVWDVGHVKAESNLVYEPIAHWTFDEGTGDVAEDTSGHYDGTVVGVSDWTEGKIGGALALNGGSYVIIANSPDLNADSDMISISVWLMFHDEGQTDKYQYILRKWLSNDGEWGSFILSRAPGNKIISGVQNKGVKQWPSWSILNGLSANEWHHVVFTYKKDSDGDNHVGPEDGNLYIDGIEVNTKFNHVGNFPYTDSFYIQYCDTSYCKLYIGREFYDSWGKENSENYSGLIDELAIWDVALDDSAVEELYNAGDPSGSPPEPECPVNDTLAPAGSVHAYDNIIWPPNNKMVSVTLVGYVRDELSIARDGEGMGVSSAYLLVDGTEWIVLLDQTTDLLDEAGQFSVDIEVKAIKGAEYGIELFASDTNPEESGGPNTGFVDSTRVHVPDSPKP